MPALRTNIAFCVICCVSVIFEIAVCSAQVQPPIANDLQSLSDVQAPLEPPFEANKVLNVAEGQVWTQNGLPPIVGVEQFQIQADDQRLASLNLSDDYYVAEGQGDSGYFESAQVRPQKKWKWFATVEATFLRPEMDRPNALTGVFNFQKTIYTEIFARNLDAYYSAPRLELGLHGQKHDIVFRYWHLDFSESEYMNPQSFIDQGQPTQIGSAFDQIDVDMYYLDLEIQRPIGLSRNSNAKFALGTRYVDFQTSAFAQASDLFPGDIFGSFNRYNEQNYQGSGFIAGLLGSRALRKGWSLDWKGRVSGIFGTYYQTQSQVGAFNGDFALSESTIRNSTTTTNTQTRNVTPGYNVEARANATAPDTNTLWIFEGQLALKYSRQFACIPARGHFSFGFEYQHWDLPNGQVDAAIALGTTLADPLSVSSGVNLTGFNTSAGITY